MADGQGPVGQTGVGPLLGLEPPNIEKSGLISPVNEDPNPAAIGSPLLGTTSL